MGCRHGGVFVMVGGDLRDGGVSRPWRDWTVGLCVAAQRNVPLFGGTGW